MTADFNARFAGQTAILQSLDSLWTPIAQAGPDQQGFGANELATLRTDLGEGVGANYGKASVALNNVLAARGGGNEFLPTGAKAALRANLAASAANELSTGQRQITLANFAQGRQNWREATAGLNALASQFNPGEYSGQAGTNFSTAFGEADKITQEQNQKESAIAGGIASLAMDAATFGAGGIANLGAGESFGEGLGDFFKGGIGALGGGK